MSSYDSRCGLTRVQLCRLRYPIAVTCYMTFETVVVLLGVLPYLNYPVNIVHYVLLCASYVTGAPCFWITALIDPGIIPPKPLEEQIESQDLTEEGYRWCETCHIWRDQMASHCDICGFCVERYDHHCGFTASCIGRRNHRFFLYTLLVAVLGHCTIIAGIIQFLKDIRGTYGSGMWSFWWVYLLLVFLNCCGYLTILLTTLAGIQLVLNIFFGTTEKQVFGRRKVKVQLSKIRFCWSHFTAICCSPLGKGFRRYEHLQGKETGFLPCQ